MTNENGKWPLPEGWEWTTIGSITQPIEKIQPKETPDKVFSYLDISGIDNERNVVAETKTYLGSEAPSRARQLVNSGDVLFSTVRTYLRNIAVVPETYDGQIASTGFSILRGEEGVESKYLFYYTLTDEFLDDLSKLQRGTSYPAVRDRDVRKQPFPLAPLPEQERIVAEIEKQFTRLDTAVAALERVQAGLARYKASVLKAAVEGRLVPQDPDAEPADVLLQRILAERRAKWEAEYPGQTYKELKGPETTELPKLPVGWVWASVEQVARVASGQTPKGIKDVSIAGDIPWYKVGDMNRPGNEEFMREAETYLTASDVDQLGLRLYPPSSIIFPKRGGAIATNKKRLLTTDSTLDLNTMVIIPDDNLCERYLWTWFSGIDLASLSTGSNVPQINHGDISPLILPIPPLDQQEQIAATVDHQMSVLLAVEHSVIDGLQHVQRLRQAILLQAFQGRLLS